MSGSISKRKRRKKKSNKKIILKGQIMSKPLSKAMFSCLVATMPFAFNIKNLDDGFKMGKSKIVFDPENMNVELHSTSQVLYDFWHVQELFEIYKLSK